MTKLVPSRLGDAMKVPALVIAALAATAGVARGEPLVLRQEFAHPVEKVWAALTRKGFVDRYYLAPLGETISADGQAIYYGRPDRKLIVGIVLAHQPPRLLRHTFQFAGAGNADSVVSYTLVPTATGTILHLEHTGYPADSQDHADIAGGWPIILAGLSALLDGKK